MSCVGAGGCSASERQVVVQKVVISVEFTNILLIAFELKMHVGPLKQSIKQQPVARFAGRQSIK